MRALLIATLLLTQAFAASHADAGRFLKRRRTRCRSVCPAPCPAPSPSPTPYRIEVPTSTTMWFCKLTQICSHQGPLGQEQTQVYGEGMGMSETEACTMAQEMLESSCDELDEMMDGELLGEPQTVYSFPMGYYGTPVRSVLPCKDCTPTPTPFWYCRLCVRFANGMKLPIGEMGQSRAQAYAKARKMAHEVARHLNTRVCFVTHMGCKCIAR